MLYIKGLMHAFLQRRSETMKFSKSFTATCFTFLMFLLATAANAFPIPEKLIFDISWSGIKAGTATQEILRDGDVLRMVSTARSATWLSAFFTVDDRIEAVMTRATPELPIGFPASYTEKVHEGPTRRHKVVTFNHHQQQALVDDLIGKSKTTFAITPITYDSLSCFFYARTQKMEPGSSFFVDVFDGKKLVKTEVKVIGREMVETDMGKFRTVHISPTLKTEGIFSKTGDIHIWLTDDERRIPVRMRSKVKIGSITATLVGGSYWPGKK